MISTIPNLLNPARKIMYHQAYLHTYSMVQSPSWEANWFAVSQEIPRISRYPEVHYRTHKRPPPVSILGQPNGHTSRNNLVTFEMSRLTIVLGLISYLK